MRMRKRCILIASLLGLWVLCSVGLGASLNGFGVWWNAITGGGGHSTGGNFAVDGSVGQPIVGASSGGGFGVSAGFWTLGGALPPQATPTHTPTGPAPQTPTPTWTLPPGPTPTLPVQPCPNILPGGDFEGPLEPPWGLFGEAQVSTARAHSGVHSLRLLGSNGGFSEVGAALELPSDATSVTLSLWWYVESGDPNPGADTLTVAVGGPGGEEPLETFSNTSPRDSWQHSRYALSGRAGQPVGLTLFAHSDPDNVTTFFVDDVELQVCTGPAPGAYQLYLPVVVKLLWR